jgi:oligosaccharide repeat unit polymerase
MDLWHFTLFFNVLTIHILLPFCRSDLNIFALGPALLRRTQAHVTEAYLISAFGYVCLLVGGSLWRIHLGVGLREGFSRLVEIPTRGSLLLLRSKGLLVTHGIVATVMLTTFILYCFKSSGFGFGVSKILLTNPALRPLAQFINFYSVLIASYCAVRLKEYRERSMMLIVAAISIGILIYGSRNALLSIFMLTIIVSFIQMRERLRLIWLALGGFSAFCLAFLLNVLHSGKFSPGSVVLEFVMSTFYGNSFSDTRDFATVLSFWDGSHFWGKTYIAGLIAFVPRFMSSFRDIWSLGVVTATMAGFSPTEHAGLRIGVFGEAYLNFGLVGVLLLGLFIGGILRLMDLRMKQSVILFPQSDIRAYSYYILGMLATFAENSSTASTCYTVLLILFVSWIMLRVSVFLKLPIH